VTGWPLYLLGIVLAALAVWRAPRPRLRTLFILWLVGLFLSRLAPAFTAMFLISRGAPERTHTASVLAIGWTGSLVLLYTLLSLTLRDRPFRRRTWLAFIGLALAILFGYSNGIRPTAAILLSIPWLWSARWSLAMSGGRLTAVSFGALRELSEGGLLLGLSPEAEYEETAVQMEPGSTLAVFTDGVTDAQSPEAEFFGRERLIATLGGGARSETCAGLLERVVAEIQRFEGVAPQYDDITLVLARRT